MENIRKIIENCSRDKFDTFIINMSNASDFKMKRHRNNKGIVAQEIYSFSSDMGNVSVVYEIKSCTLVLTAVELLIERAVYLYHLSDKSQAESKKSKNITDKKSDKTNKDINKPVKKTSERELTKHVNNKKQVTKPKTNSVTEAANEFEKHDSHLEYKDGFCVRKVNEDNIARIINEVRTVKGVSCRKIKSNDKSVSVYEVKNSTDKVILRHNITAKVLQLQGKRSILFSEVQIKLGQCSATSATGSAQIQFKHDKNVKADKLLRKYLPDAISYMSEQAKIDIAIGLTDINNSDVKLSDYSMLLIPPYRGLEKFIFDLQHAKGIQVKMIGQAFDKTDDGKYILKSGYLKRIKSVVYAEVLVSLYTEYFMRRNFYMHSDNGQSDMTSRVIDDKSQVKAMFDNMLAVLNYNARKLKEIGFDKIEKN